MGAVITAPFRLAVPVAHADVAIVGYPAGYEQQDFIGDFAAPTGIVVINANDVYREADGDVLLAYNGPSVSIVNLTGTTWGAGSEVIAQLAWLDPAGEFGGITTTMTAEQIVARMEEAAADAALALRMGKATVPALQGVVDEASTARSQLATAVVGAHVAAIDDEKKAVWDGFTALDVSTRATMIGDLTVGPNRDGPMNPGEALYIDVDARGSGFWFTPAATGDIIDGTAGELPQDPESNRLVRSYYDASGDISSGALELDLRENPNVSLEFAAALDLSFTEIASTAIGQGLSGRVEFKNTDGSEQTVTFVLSGSGLNDVVPVNGTGSSLAVPAGGTRAIYVSLAAGGWYEISQVVPT